MTQRGNRRLPIFFGDSDREAYLGLLAAALPTSAVSCLAWCLMDNHVHLIFVTVPGTHSSGDTVPGTQHSSGDTSSGDTR